MLGKINEEFLLTKLEGKKHFAQLCIQASDDKELLEFTKNALQKRGYFAASVDSQILDGKNSGALEGSKPAKILVKGVKKVKLGSKHPSLWKISSGVTGLSAIAYLLFATTATQPIIGSAMLGSALLSAGTFLRKETVKLTLWIKALGVLKNGNARFKLFMAAEPSASEPVSEDYLRESFAEIKDHYSRNFLKHSSMKGFIDETTDFNAVLENLNAAQDNMKRLDEELQSNKIADHDYERRIIDYEKQRANALLALELLAKK